MHRGLPNSPAGGDNLTVSGVRSFQPGSIVIVTLSNPREKFWGNILSLAPEGLSLCGVELSSFDDFLHMIKAGEPCSPGIVFFPMHRIERLQLDLPEGEVPSLSQRLASKTGLEAQQLLSTRETP